MDVSKLFWPAFERHYNKNNNIIRQRSVNSRWRHMVRLALFVINLISTCVQRSTHKYVEWNTMRRQNLSERKHFEYERKQKRSHHYAILTSIVNTRWFVMMISEIFKFDFLLKSTFCFHRNRLRWQMNKSPAHSAPYRNWILFCCVKPDLNDNNPTFYCGNTMDLIAGNFLEFPKSNYICINFEILIFDAHIKICLFRLFIVFAVVPIHNY